MRFQCCGDAGSRCAGPEDCCFAGNECLHHRCCAMNGTDVRTQFDSHDVRTRFDGRDEARRDALCCSGKTWHGYCAPRACRPETFDVWTPPSCQSADECCNGGCVAGRCCSTEGTRCATEGRQNAGRSIPSTECCSGTCVVDFQGYEGHCAPTTSTASTTSSTTPHEVPR